MARKPPTFRRPSAHFRLLALLLPVLIVGCASVPPPVNRLGHARDALQQALAAKAKTYAPLEVGFAQAKLGAADQAMKSGDYQFAANLAAESQVNSELARVKAELGVVHQKIKQQTAENQRLREQLLDQGQSNPDQTGAKPGTVDDGAKP